MVPKHASSLFESQNLYVLFQGTAITYPDTQAVVHEDSEMTYAQLEDRSHVLSRLLAQAGAKPGSLICLCLERCIDIIAGMLAVFRLGAAYIPLDPASPDERIATILEDIESPLVLTRSQFQNKFLKTQATCVVIDSKTDSPSQQMERGGHELLTSEIPAYVLFTSGSTGRPKGVCCQHKGVVNLLADFQARRTIGPEDRCSWWTSFQFDVSVYEIFSALTSGATLVIVPEEIRRDTYRFMDWLRQEGISSAYIPPMMVTELADWVKDKPGHSQLRRLLVGVEPIPERLLIQILIYVPKLTIINGYGPTETTICATLYEVSLHKRVQENTPIGKPVQNMWVSLISPEGKPVRRGEVGEMYIGGVGVGLGYLNRPQQTRSAFVFDASSSEHPGPVYKSGDLARELEDGNLEFIGRTDFQIKWHGHRIELGEIEVQLRRHPQVREARVLLQDDQTGKKILVAYLVCSQSSPPPIKELRQGLLKKLPLYMVPSVFVSLDKIPMTENGKTDRSALPLPDKVDLDALRQDSFVPPEGIVEEQISTLFAGVLGLSEIGRNESFFLLGGNSLQATRMCAALESLFSARIPLETFFADPTVKGLARTLLKKRNDLSTIHSTIQQAPPERISFPLSTSQQGIWFAQQLNPDKGIFNIPLVVDLNGSVQVRILEQAFNQVLYNHAILRTVFVLENGEPVQKIVSMPGLSLPMIDLSNLSTIEQEEQVTRLGQEQGLPVFDLSQGPLFRATLVKLNDNDFKLFLTFHHLVIDGWGVSVFFQELGQAYAALFEDRPPPRAQCELRYHDFALWEQNELKGPRIKAQIEAWLEVLSVPRASLHLPFARRVSDGPHSDGARVSVCISKESTSHLHEFCRTQGVTMFMALMAVLQTLLHIYSRQSDIITGTTIAHRNHPQLEDMLGVFINSLIVRTDFSGQPVFVQILRQVRQRTLQAFDNPDVPFESLVDTLHAKRIPGRHPLFQILFLFQNTPRPPVSFADIQMSYEEVGNQTAKLDILFNLEEKYGRIEGWMEYNTALFSFRDMQIMSNDFVRMVKEVLEQPDKSIRDLQRPRLLDSLDRPGPRCFVIGEGSLPIRCMEILQDNGFVLLGLITSDKNNQVWAEEMDIPWYTPTKDLEWILHREPFDYLFSIVNGYILSHSVLQIPLRFAINYHDSLLPQYAGRNATAWALVHKEPIHGITWHIMEPDIDTGDILKQMEVKLSPDETSFSLNLKCYEAALQSFHSLLPELKTGQVDRVRQDLTQRTLFKSDNRPRAGCLIDWEQKSEDIFALFRALSFGQSENPLGLPKVKIGHGVYCVSLLQQEKSIPAQNPLGTVLRMDQEQIVIKGDGLDLALKGVLDRDGQSISIPDLIDRTGLKTGDCLSRMEPHVSEKLGQAHKRLAKHESFWSKRLQELQPLELPWARNLTNPEEGHPWSSCHLDLPEALMAPGRVLGQAWLEKDQGLVLLSLLAAALGRLADADFFSLGLQSQELGELIKELPDFFAPFVPWNIQLDLEICFQDQRDDLFQGLDTCLKNETYPRDLVKRVPSLASQKDLPFWITNSLALIQVERWEGCDLDTLPLASFIVPRDESRIYALFQPQAVPPGGMYQVLNTLKTLCLNILDKPQIPLKNLPLLSTEEKTLILETWNETGRDYPLSTSYHELFEDQVRKTPNNIAVEMAGIELTYIQLNSRANQLANFLRDEGLGSGDIAAVFMDKDLELPAMLLAVLKTGAAYVPLDVNYPRERIAFMLEDSQVKCILTMSRHETSLPDHQVRCFALDELTGQIQSKSSRAPEVQTEALDPVYVIYTSGSTGRPKGVILSHQGLVNHSLSAVDRYDLQPEDRVLQFFSVSFDGAVEEIFAPWLRGAALILPHKSVLSAALEFSQLLEDLEISILDLPTAFWQEWVNGLMASGGRLPQCLKAVIVGGEKAAAKTYATWSQMAQGSVRWYNTYGPTETTVVSTMYTPSDQQTTDGKKEIPIGRPIANTRVYVTDRFMTPVPCGFPGELLIGGAGVALGYLNQPELTSERFLEDPFSTDRGKVYRTGDRVCFRPEGDLEYLGRIDSQLKIRGFRVEPGEIEAVLVSHPGVDQAAVVGQEDVHGNSYLAGYYVVKEGQSIHQQDLQVYIAARLPEYMVPRALAQVEELPHLPNGKIDRKGLPAITTLSSENIPGFITPQNDFENDLAQVWERVLGRQPIGRNDNFFDIGGHSLLAVRLCAEIEKELGLTVPLSALFETSDIQGLAQILQKEQGEKRNNLVSVIGLQTSGNGIPLFFIHVLGRGCKFCRPLVRCLGRQYRAYGLSVHFADPVPEVDNNVPDLASFYIQEMRKVQPEGPYQLAGISFGGMVAFEMARQLTTQGQEVGLLAILDTLAPGGMTQTDVQTRSQVHWQAFQEKGLSYVLQKICYRLKRVSTLWDRLYVQFQLARLQFETWRGRQLSADLKDLSARKENDRASNKYMPGDYPKDAVIFKCTDWDVGVSSEVDPLLGWGRFIQGTLRVHNVPGDHLGMLCEPEVRVLAEQLRPYLLFDRASTINSILLNQDRQGKQRAAD
jgi:amino acid adenylation domain-containing protein